MAVTRQLAVVVVSLLVVAAVPAFASVSGYAKVDGTEVTPSHAVAIWSKSTAFGEQGERVLRVLLAMAPIYSNGIDEALDREGALRSSIDGDFAIVTLNTDGSLSNFYLYIDEGAQNYGLPSGVAETESIGESQVVGRAFTEGEESLGDTTISYDLSFTAEILPERPPGEDLGTEGGAPGAAYTAFLAGIHDGDVETIVAHAEAYTAQRLRETEEEWLEDEISSLQEMAPREMKVTGGELFDGWAILEVQGSDWSGDKVEGLVKMVFDRDSWRFDGDDLDYVW